MISKPQSHVFELLKISSLNFRNAVAPVAIFLGFNVLKRAKFILGETLTYWNKKGITIRTILPTALEKPSPAALTAVGYNSVIYTLIDEEQKAETAKQLIVSIVAGVPEDWIRSDKVYFGS